MPVRHTEAIILRTYRVGEADKIVVLLSRELGKVRGVAKGARRPRSRFGGSLEMGSEVDLTFFEKEGRELVSLDRCDMIRSGFSSSGEPVVACTLAYFADLVDSFAPEREPNAKLYRLLKACLECLAEGRTPEPISRYFEAWVLRLGGFYPRNERCPVCQRDLGREGGQYLLDQQPLRCARCTSEGIALSPKSMRYLQSIWRTPPTQLPRPNEQYVSAELARFHRKLISQQIDRELGSLQILEDLMRLEERA